MANIDQFESVFKAADKPQFAQESILISRVIEVTDLDATASRNFLSRTKDFLGDSVDQQATWGLIDGGDFDNVESLVRQCTDDRPDLICTYRNLHIPAPDYPHSLGVYIDVLTQVTDIPVLLLPNPHAYAGSEFATNGRDSVMAITDHLTGDHHLVSFAAQLTQASGKLFLTHVEEAIFDRYIATIGRIPAIDTDIAREEILEQLLEEPHDYIRSCRAVLEQTTTSFHVEEIVTVGHQLSDYKRLIDEHEVDLLVLNTKDDDQLAMHGLAYPLAVELRQVPLLLL